MFPAIASRASAWWLAWKWVVILVVLLAASCWLNVHQWKRAITAPMRAEIAAKEKALADSQGLLIDMHATAERLERASGKVASNLNKASREYEQAVKDRPLPPQCAPGKARVDAVNSTLGATENP